MTFLPVVVVDVVPPHHGLFILWHADARGRCRHVMFWLFSLDVVVVVVVAIVGVVMVVHINLVEAVVVMVVVMMMVVMEVHMVVVVVVPRLIWNTCRIERRHWRTP